MTARPSPTRDVLVQLVKRVEALEGDSHDVKNTLAEIKILIEAVAVIRTGGHFISWLSKMLFALAIIAVVWKAGLFDLFGVHQPPG